MSNHNDQSLTVADILAWIQGIGDNAIVETIEYAAKGNGIKPNIWIQIPFRGLFASGVMTDGYISYRQKLENGAIVHEAKFVGIGDAAVGATVGLAISGILGVIGISGLAAVSLGAIGTAGFAMLYKHWDEGPYDVIQRIYNSFYKNNPSVVPSNQPLEFQTVDEHGAISTYTVSGLKPVLNAGDRIEVRGDNEFHGYTIYGKDQFVGTVPTAPIYSGYLPGMDESLMKDRPSTAVSDYIKERSIDLNFIAVKDDDYMVDPFTPRGQVQSVNNWVTAAMGQIKYAATFKSPLVLDMDGDGVELVHKDNGVFFDIDNDGFKEKVGWVKADDAQLAKDNNGNGVIDNITELFGDDVAGQSAYQKLAKLDSNKDKLIDAKDAAFQDLKIWQDKNQDGVSQADELKTLDQANIASISLNQQSLNQYSQENFISAKSEFTLKNGLKGTMYDVHYLNDDVNSRFQGKATGPLPIKMEAVLLPQSRGYGEMPALHIALSNDENLLSLVKSFVSLKPYEMGLMSSMLEEIMYQWAGVSEVDPDKFNTGEGQNIDARKVAFIEKFTGQPWLQLGVSRFVGQAAGQTLEDVWETMVNRMADRLLVQGPWKSMFPNVEYDFESDRLILKNSFDDIISRAREYARTVDDSPLFWLKLANVLLHQKEDLGITVDRINTALTGVLGSGVSFDNGEWAQSGNDSANTIHGTDYNDKLIGNGGDDVIDGGKRNDDIDGGEGHDTLRGGEGLDWIKGGAGNDRIEGGAGKDVIDAGLGDDTVQGGEGDDSIDGNSGTDTIDGGPGKDTVRYSSVVTNWNYGYIQMRNMGAEVDLAAGTGSYVDIATGRPQKETDNLVNMENIGGSFGNDKLYGNDGPNQINGEAGDDDIDGRGGDDVLFGADGNNNIKGGSGNDVVLGFSGADAIDGGSGEDTVVYNDARGTGGITVNLETGAGSGGHAEGDKYSNIENVEGSPWGDTITGDNANNNLKGAAGNDTLNGGRGNDMLEGGRGNNVLDGGEGEDTVSYASSAPVFVKLSSGQAVTLAGDEDRLISIEHVQGSAYGDVIDGDAKHNQLKGGAGSDDIDGAAGDDVIYGEEGDDTLNGGRGVNTLYGGAGKDTFEVVLGFDEQTTVADFSAEDKIKVTGYVSSHVWSTLHPRQVGADVVLQISSVQRLVLLNTRLDALTKEQLSGFRNDMADPDAFPDSGTVNEDGEVVIAVLANDTKGELGVPLTAAHIQIEQPAHGVVRVNDDGTVTYKPTGNYSGEDVFYYRLVTPLSGSFRVPVTMTINPVNDAPEARMQEAFGKEGAVMTIDVLSQATDVDHDVLTVSVARVHPDKGTVEIKDNKIIFTPSAKVNGDVSIHYVVSDGLLGTAKDMVVHVAPQNHAPVAQTLEKISMLEDTSITIDVLAGATDADGDVLVVKENLLGKILDLLLERTPSINTSIQDNKLVLAPKKDFSGVSSVSYEVSDGVASVRKTVQVEVLPVNDAPRFIPQATLAVPKGTAHVLTGSELATDIDGDALIAQQMQDGIIIRAHVSGDSYLGAPQVLLSLDGQIFGAGKVITAVHKTNQWQTLEWILPQGTVPNLVGLRFANDLREAGKGDRNVYVDHITINGEKLSPKESIYTIANSAAIAGQETMHSNGMLNFDVTSILTKQGLKPLGSVTSINGQLTYTAPQHFEGQDYVALKVSDGQATAQSIVAIDTHSASPEHSPNPVFTTPGAAVQIADHLPSGAFAYTVITARVSGDSYNGAPQAQLLLNGTPYGARINVTANHSAGAWTTLSWKVPGENMPSVLKTISIAYSNDAYASPTQDRNLYVDGLNITGLVVPKSQGVFVRKAGGEWKGVDKLTGNGEMRFDVSTLAIAKIVQDNADGTVWIKNDQLMFTPKANIFGEKNITVGAETFHVLVRGMTTGTVGHDKLMATDTGSILNGAEGADILRGGKASDVLNGGSATDILTGLQGQDYFRFKLPTDSLKKAPDVIMDFESGEDKIDLSGMNLDYNSLHFTPNADGMLMHSGDFGVQLHGITAPLPSSDYLF